MIGRPRDATSGVRPDFLNNPSLRPHNMETTNAQIEEK
jgi:hypothetical protein